MLCCLGHFGSFINIDIEAKPKGLIIHHISEKPPVKLVHWRHRRTMR